MKPAFAVFLLVWVVAGVLALNQPSVRNFRFPEWPKVVPYTTLEQQAPVTAIAPGLQGTCATEQDFKNYVDTVVKNISKYPRFAVQVNGTTFVYKLSETIPPGGKE